MADSSSGTTSVSKTEAIWLDGRFVPWDGANVHIMTLGLHYGLGVFEGIRAYRCADGRTAVFRLSEHIRRMFDSARILLLQMPYTQEQVGDVCAEILRVNKMDHGYVRPLAFMAEGAMGLGTVNPTRVAVMAWDWGSYLGDDGIKHGIRAKVSSFTRPHVNGTMPRGKITGQYINSILAKREAKLAGYDEAILLDGQGLVAEATGENVFMARGGRVFTPPLTSPILEGITRDSVIELLRGKGVEVVEATFTRDTLYCTDEVFLCGTAAEITPVREVDDRAIGSGQAGPLTRLAQESFFKAVHGEDPQHERWLRYL